MGLVHFAAALFWYSLSRVALHGCNTDIPAAVEQLPIDPQETLYQGTCPHCKASTIVPDTDVMDTWNTSALTPYIIYELVSGKQVTFTDQIWVSRAFPMSMRPQAHDIIRTWAFYTSPARGCIIT